MVTADTENLGAVEVIVSVGLLATTINDVAGNETVSFYTLMVINALACNLHQKTL